MASTDHSLHGTTISHVLHMPGLWVGWRVGSHIKSLSRIRACLNHLKPWAKWWHCPRNLPWLDFHGAAERRVLPRAPYRLQLPTIIRIVSSGWATAATCVLSVTLCKSFCPPAAKGWERARAVGVCVWPRRSFFFPISRISLDKWVLFSQWEVCVRAEELRKIQKSAHFFHTKLHDVSVPVSGCHSAPCHFLICG